MKMEIFAEYWWEMLPDLGGQPWRFQARMRITKAYRGVDHAMALFMALVNPKELSIPDVTVMGGQVAPELF